MIKQAPSVGRIVAMVAFTLSCFGILLFLWLSFGGSVPLRPDSYRLKVAFPEATQLAQEAEVRISGVPVGTVTSVQPNEQTGLTDTVLEIDARYAPIPRDARGILRQKTLLGETYVELSPGSDESGTVADGGNLAQGQVSDTVELDEILRTFDPLTRSRFSTWLDQQGQAVRGNGEEISASLGNLTPFAEETDEVLATLRSQSGDTRRLVRDTGAVFEALTERQGQLRDLIVNSNRVWEVTARRNEQLADTFRVLPTFLRESRVTTRRLTRFAEDTDPLVTQLRPAARELSPTLIDLEALAPDLRGPVPRPRSARAGLPPRPPGHRAGARQHAAAAAAGRSLPAPAHADRRLPRPLQARDRRLLRQRHRGHAGAGREPARPRAGLHYLRTPEPDQPGDDGRLPHAPVHQPLEPLHRARRVRQAAHREPPRGVRLLPLRHHAGARASPPRRPSGCPRTCST